MACTSTNEIDATMQLVITSEYLRAYSVDWDFYDAEEVFSDGEIDIRTCCIDKGILVPFFVRHDSGPMKHQEYIVRVLLRYTDDIFPQRNKLRILDNACIKTLSLNARGFQDFNMMQGERFAEENDQEEVDSSQGLDGSACQSCVPTPSQRIQPRKFRYTFSHNDTAVKIEVLEIIFKSDRSKYKRVTLLLSDTFGGKPGVYNTLVTSMRNEDLLVKNRATNLVEPLLTEKGLLLLKTLQNQVPLHAMEGM